MNLADIVGKIKAEARARGLTDRELAARADMSPEALSRLGRHNGARVDTVERLAAVVGLELSLVPQDSYLAALQTGTLLRNRSE
jgi:transcriptional regulator with XRE-family HTH domain